MQEVSECVQAICNDAQLPALSIVVIGRNEGSRLAKCLDSIKLVRGAAVREIIYCDSASTDGSPELASRYGATVIVVRPERPTAAIGRNAGPFHAIPGDSGRKASGSKSCSQCSPRNHSTNHRGRDQKSPQIGWNSHASSDRSPTFLPETVEIAVFSSRPSTQGCGERPFPANSSVC